LEPKFVDILEVGAGQVQSPNFAKQNDHHRADARSGQDEPCPYSVSSIFKTSNNLGSNVVRQSLNLNLIIRWNAYQEKSQRISALQFHSKKR
jgi:hypothetical protein